MTLEEFLLLLPKANKLPIALAPSEYEKHGLEDPAPYPLFVSPTLLEASSQPGPPSVLLVSAPGAVGKTTLAREIARSIASPLWHLGQVNVGHEFLTGAIARAFGRSQYSQVHGELVSGQRALVLDGLDEARLRAGEQNFEAFLESLAEDFRDPSGRPALVLLGRSDTVNDTAGWFELFGVAAARYEIEYFDPTSAIMFVAKYLDAQAKTKPHVRAAPEFARARDAVLNRLQQAVPDGVHPRSLAGYAPVLALVSKLLDVANPYAEYQDILRESQKWRLQTLVRDIARGLLDREHTKTVLKLADELGSQFEWSNAYLPDEQCLRLLAARTAHAMGDPPPADLPPALREPYERKLKSWVGEHPFAAQPLFMDYVYAWLFTREQPEPQLSVAVRSYLCGSQDRLSPYRPTPLLARFVADLAAGDAGEPQLRMGAGDFGFVYESVLAAAPATQHSKLTLVSSGETADIVGELRSGVEAEASSMRQRVPVRLLYDGTGLWFWRRLYNADIQITTHIHIGARRTDFLLGPDVDIEAASFGCDSPTVRIDAPTREMAVLLTANTYRGDVVEFLGTHDERQHLRVTWTPRQYPWARYALEVEPEVPVGPKIREAFRRLRRILVCFRAEGYSEMARHEDLLDNPAVAGSGPARDMLNYCVKQRLIRRERPMYVLDRGALNRLGINWPDIRERRISRAIAGFLDGFLQHGR